VSIRDIIDLRFPSADAQRIRFGLEHWSRLMANMEPIFTDGLRLLESHLSHAFDAEGAQGRGGRWAPLSTKYAQKKAITFPGNQILVRTGAMRLSLTTMGHPGAIRQATASGLVFGSAVPWARFHQVGSSRLPKRPPFDWSNSFTDRGSVAWGFAQLAQAHVIYARDRAVEGNNPIHPSRTLTTLRAAQLH
jgi:phage gpG-like protein